MIKELIKLANHLDSKGLVREADTLDRLIKESFLSPALIGLCFLGACKEVSVESLGLDYEFNYNSKGEAVDVNSIPINAATKTSEPSKIILTWPCDNWQVLREIFHLDVDEEFPSATISAEWDLNSSGVIKSERVLSGRVSTC